MNIVAGYNDNPMQPQSRLICHFYQRGMCRFGNRCRNVHSDIRSSEVPERSKKTEQHSSRNAPPIQKNTPVTSSAQSSMLPSAPDNKTESMDTTTAGGPSTSSTMDTSSTLPSKECGICFDTILEKNDIKDQIFGILPNCNHCFCFSCLRKWRQSKEFDFDVSKACPECRKPSDYVYPSKIWFELKAEKDLFISKEKLRMQQIDCRYFNKGQGSCPFGNTCLYLHALRNGTRVDVGPPRPRRRRSSNIDSEMLHQILYWLNDDDLDMDDDEDLDNDFDLDLDDPEIAMQYYDHGDIRRYIAMERFVNNAGSDTESEDFDFPLFLA